MPASMNHTESQPGEMVPLRDVSRENGLRNPALEQRTPSHNEGLERNVQEVGRRRWMLGKKIILIVILAVLALLALIFIPLYFVQNEQIKQLEAQVKQLEAQVKQSEVASTPKLHASCPQGWILYAEQCYFFSINESTWNLSLSYCSLSGGSLIVMTTPEEMAFINGNKAPAEYWLGLQRDSKEDPWKQSDGTEVVPWFEIKGEGRCASLNDGVVSSTACDSLRHWICRKPLHAA